MSSKTRLDHLAALALSMGVRLDADETGMFARSLEYVESQVYQVQYAALKGTVLVPVKGDVDPGADFFTWSLLDKTGVARRVENYAADFPRVNVQGDQITTPIKSYGDSYEYSIQDLRRVAQAKRMGLGVIELDTQRALVAREAIARKIEAVIALGDSEVGVPGFLNNASVPIVAVTGSGNWEGRWNLAATTDAKDAIAFEALQDLLKMDRNMFSDTKEVEAPTTLVLATSLYNWVASTPASHLVPQVTILQAFKTNAQHIREVESWTYLETASATGGPRIVAYKRDPTRLQAILPIEFEAQPPQARNMAFVVNCHGRCGGTIVRYPRSVNYMDGCGAT